MELKLFKNISNFHFLTFIQSFVYVCLEIYRREGKIGLKENLAIGKVLQRLKNENNLVSDYEIVYNLFEKQIIQLSVKPNLLSITYVLRLDLNTGVVCIQERTLAGVTTYEDVNLFSHFK
jgi:hypothetical protein